MEQDREDFRSSWNAIASGYDEFVTPTHMWLANEGLTRVTVETITEALQFDTGPQLWDWVVNSNPLSRMILGMLEATLDQETVIQARLEELIRERAGGRADQHSPHRHRDRLTEWGSGPTLHHSQLQCCVVRPDPLFSAHVSGLASAAIHDHEVAAERHRKTVFREERIGIHGAGKTDSRPTCHSPEPARRFDDTRGMAWNRARDVGDRSERTCATREPVAHTVEDRPHRRKTVGHEVAAWKEEKGHRIDLRAQRIAVDRASRRSVLGAQSANQRRADHGSDRKTVDSYATLDAILEVSQLRFVTEERRQVSGIVIEEVDDNLLSFADLATEVEREYQVTATTELDGDIGLRRDRRKCKDDHQKSRSQEHISSLVIDQPSRRVHALSDGTT
jgi:hypothetical protein